MFLSYSFYNIVFIAGFNNNIHFYLDAMQPHYGL